MPGPGDHQREKLQVKLIKFPKHPRGDKPKTGGRKGRAASHANTSLHSPAKRRKRGNVKEFTYLPPPAPWFDVTLYCLGGTVPVSIATSRAASIAPIRGVSAILPVARLLPRSGHVRSAEVPWLYGPAKRWGDWTWTLDLKLRRTNPHTIQDFECPAAEWSAGHWGRESGETHTHTREQGGLVPEKFGLAMEADQTGFSSSSSSGVAGVPAAAGSTTCSDETEDSTPPTPNNRWAHSGTRFFFHLFSYLVELFTIFLNCIVVYPLNLFDCQWKCHNKCMDADACLFTKYSY